MGEGRRGEVAKRERRKMEWGRRKKGWREERKEGVGKGDRGK